MAALSKPLFPLATTAWPVLGARFLDRIGKGIRGAPRDAMIADETPPALRGRAFGLRQALDTIGAMIAPILAIALMAAFAGDMRGELFPLWSDPVSICGVGTSSIAPAFSFCNDGLSIATITMGPLVWSTCGVDLGCRQLHR